MRTVSIHPLDTLLFRDTRPFEGDIDGLAQARSQFPPLPSITAGALRAAIARAHGWRGSGNWKHAGLDPESQAVLDTLGDGPWNTGHWRFGPPLVCKFFENGAEEPLVPCPAHVLKHCDDGSLVLGTLKIEDTRGISSDLGNTGLNRFAFAAGKDAQKYSSCLGSYISSKDMRLVMQGRPPTRVISAGEISQSQERMGIWLDADRRTALNARLYVAAQTRLADDCAAHYGLRVDVGHVAGGSERAVHDDALNGLSSGVLPLGGGGRAASAVTQEATDPPPNSPPTSGGTCALVFLSPVVVGQSDVVVSQCPFGIVGSEVVSVSSGSPILFSPWAYGAGQRDASHYLLPAGTVVFIAGKFDELEKRSTALAAPFADHSSLGGHTNLGFGAFRFANWPQVKT